MVMDVVHVSQGTVPTFLERPTYCSAPSESNTAYTPDTAGILPLAGMASVAAKEEVAAAKTVSSRLPAAWLLCWGALAATRSIWLADLFS
jgi:hypothetical protein